MQRGDAGFCGRGRDHEYERVHILFAGSGYRKCARGAREVRDVLLQRRVSVFLDDRDIEPGTPFPDELADVVTQRLSRLQQTLGERLPADSRAVRLIREDGTIPLAGSLAGIREYLEQLPDSLNEHFVGRDHTLWKAFNALEAGKGGGGAPRSLLPQGGGGTGKTQIAAEYVWRYGRRFYTGGIIWINAGDESLESQFEDVLSTLGGETEQDNLPQ